MPHYGPERELNSAVEPVWVSMIFKMHSSQCLLGFDPSISIQVVPVSKLEDVIDFRYTGEKSVTVALLIANERTIAGRTVKIQETQS